MSNPNDLYRCDYDGFEGNKIGEYTTREGHAGVVLQQCGSKVVHVYRADRVQRVGWGGMPDPVNDHVQRVARLSKARFERIKKGGYVNFEDHEYRPPPFGVLAVELAALQSSVADIFNQLAIIRGRAKDDKTITKRIEAVESVLPLHTTRMGNIQDRVSLIEEALTFPLLTPKPKD